MGVASWHQNFKFRRSPNFKISWGRSKEVVERRKSGKEKK
jgi:hypothetical protein